MKTNSTILPTISVFRKETTYKAIYKTHQCNKNKKFKQNSKISRHFEIYDNKEYLRAHPQLKTINLSSIYSNDNQTYPTNNFNNNKTFSTKNGSMYRNGPFGKEKKLLRITKMHFLKPTQRKLKLNSLELLDNKFNYLDKEYKRISCKAMKTINIGDLSNPKGTQGFRKLPFKFTSKTREKNMIQRSAIKYNVIQNRLQFLNNLTTI